MGRQPGLDGIRTFSVCLVALHHVEIVHRQIFGEDSHQEILTGGFVFPEMFFVMSGFLITTIMLQERESTGRFSLKGFYARRARRLLPALWVMMAVAIVWATLWGAIALEGRPVAERYHLAEMRWSTLFTFFMSQNWWMIFSGNGYFGGFPDLFRHIWSLSIDEQFYVVFPLLLVALYGAGRHFDLRKLVRAVVPLIIIGWLVMAFMFESPSGGDAYHLNFAYLSTITRMPGILVGVVMACLWRPWTWPNASRRHLPWLDLVGLGSFVAIMFIGFTAHNEAWYVYRGLFPVVSLLAAAVVAAVVHPGAVYTRAFFGNAVIAGIGLRAFGIYLWHWPIFAGPLATAPMSTKLLVGIPLTALFAELSYRLIETPFRERAIGKWREKLRHAHGPARQALIRPVAITSAACLFLVGALTLRLVTAAEADITSDGGIDDLADAAGEPLGISDPIVAGGTTVTVADPSDPAAATDSGTEDDPTATLEPAVTLEPAATLEPADTVEPAASVEPVDTVEPETTVSVPPQTGKIRLAIVGSSQAVMLGKNLPRSAKETFAAAQGGRSGCSVFSDGRIEGRKLGSDGEIIEGKLFKWSFKEACKTWMKAWTDTVDKVDAELVLVVTGGWEIFDLILDDQTLEFGSPAFDAYYMENLQMGIDAVLSKGVKVALLEPACQRPVDDPGAGVPPLAERRDDSRPQHIAGLMKKLAKRDPNNVFYIENADAWCNDPSISENKQYRFDGVHVLGKGAKLIMDTITPELLAIPLPGR